MKPYEQLAASYQQYVDERNTYRDQAVSAVSAALEALRDYIGAPEGKARFAPIAGARKEGAFYGPRQAVTPGADAWWSGCYLLDVGEGSSSAELSITISAFADIDGVKFRVGDSEKEHTCREVNAACLQAVVEEAVSRSQDYLQHGLVRFLGYRP